MQHLQTVEHLQSILQAHAIGSVLRQHACFEQPWCLGMVMRHMLRRSRTDKDVYRLYSTVDQSNKDMRLTCTNFAVASPEQATASIFLPRRCMTM